ncbi:bifunctional demethylmenaquinone methyltransferase/2-methoxy-6-polyprenyl-1,4-benzoquinol methylase UbiE [Nitratiruptor sp. YY09-18]|uniref:bifunctional demethylmenaquinone methyltransferase/2-methoxy-6-polyprenyl-1,4-benzoquinol methylase UbiE n=1 Tax=Nitratiruptor sp. YY09-18 TaxID=2724901 RepID=UPI0019165ECD|nr:bifunctional demethylmenaquinone methyltransferase/2-methoxy-6-polyprenyl-1,4-benzoquinol methylase UbiE [Nitratiruptor sp. YY09-18]BCD67582.1 demethylmenaquinone methyltransferase / 2-methoxy-6-polyprenyl-1,4-benzoquinol methylase [Nitratiruptor sp. YY09-18]
MDKQKKIVHMFDDIAKSYDVANRVLSFGSDIAWRKRACDLAFGFYDKDEVTQITDVACGTGDMLGFWEKIAQKRGIKVNTYLGIDPSQGMLEVAKEKFPHFSYLQAFAQNLPLEDEVSDFVSITYGIRNVVERQKALDEFARILKPGGILVILEFTKREKQTFMDNVVEFYMKKVLPAVGGFVSGNRAAYEYLPNSIDNFLTTEQLIRELQEAGFAMEYTKAFSFGISTLFIAKKRS